jgi:hypothetical protein
MKEIFKIEFDFLGRSNEIIVYTYTDYRDIVYKFDVEISKEQSECSHIILGDSTSDKWVQNILMIEKNLNDPEHYAHELLHAVKNIVNTMDITDEEVECYLLGYLIKEYLNKFEQWKQK